MDGVFVDKVHGCSLGLGCDAHNHSDDFAVYDRPSCGPPGRNLSMPVDTSSFVVDGSTVLQRGVVF